MLAAHSIRKTIKDYLFKNLDQFSSNLEKAQREYDPDAIHDYRVAVKRIRALVRAVNLSMHDTVFPDDMILPLRLMFKAGGTIRDDQVQIVLVKDIEKVEKRKFPLIKTFYAEKIKEQRNAFFVQSFELDPADIDRIKSQIEESFSGQDDQKLDAAIYEWLENAMLKLKLKRYDLDDSQRLHRFRTRYKQNSYVVEMMYQSKYDRRITKQSYMLMKDFGQTLGDWHDYFQLMANTVLIFKDSRNIKLLEEAFEMRKLIQPRHDKIMQEILHQIKRDDNLFLY